MSQPPIVRLLGGSGEPVECRRFTPDIAMHWFPMGAVVGTRCLCGETTRRPDPDLDGVPEPGDPEADRAS